MRSFNTIHISLRLIIAVTLLAGIVGASIGIYRTAYAVTPGSALSSRSPAPNSMVLDENGEANIARHILLNSDHGNVHSISLGAYYTNSTAKTVQILAGNQQCEVNTNQGNGANIVRVMFRSWKGGTPQSYFVTKRNFCSQGNFYKNYTIPQSLLQNSYDPVTQRYKVVMTVSFASPERLSTTKDTTATFSVSAPQGILGYIDTDQSTGSVPNNSILGNTNNRSGYITSIVPFGLPCNVTTGGIQTINFFDSDNGQLNVQPKNLYYYIEEQLSNNTWRRLTNTTDYTGANSATLIGPGTTGITPFNGKRTPPLAPTGSSIKIKNMKPLTRYRLVIKSLRKVSGIGSNYIYVGLPGDSIFGSDGFTCRSDYELEPSIDASPDTAEVGGTVRVTPSIDNNSNVNAGSHNWQVAKIEYGPKQTPRINKIGLNGTGNVCGSYAPKMDCDPSYITPGAGQTSFPPNSSQPNNQTTFVIPDDAQLGTTFCFVASVESPTRSDAGRWGHSDPSCVTVGKKPKMQVWGYDAKVVGSINTSLSLMSGKNYGSYSEYGLLSDGDNLKMASGNGLLGGQSGPQANWSALTFANGLNSSLSGFGQYNGVVPFVASQSGFVEGGTNVTLGSKPYTSSSPPVIHYTGTLFINGSQTYSGSPYASIDQIPRVLIFADNVVIGPNTTQIDPWIITNNLSTCSEVNDGTSYFAAPADVQIKASMCDKSLTFNGPVITKNAYLYRTAGEGKSTSNRAEVFNLRADAFLSSYAGGGATTPIASTDVIIEVPPRF